MAEKLHPIVNTLALEQRQVPLAGTARLDLVSKSASFVAGNTEEERGIMVLEATLPDTQRTLEFRVGQEALRSLERIRGQMPWSSSPVGTVKSLDTTDTNLPVPSQTERGELAEPERPISKWQSFEHCVEQILRWQEVIDIADMLREFGTRTKGTVEDQKLILESLRLGFVEHVSKITTLLETRSDGLSFLRHLLASKNESLVRLAVFVMPAPLQAAVQEDLLQIVRERRTSRDLRSLCMALLYPEIRGAYLASRRADDAPPSTAGRARRAGEAQGEDEDETTWPGDGGEENE